MRTKNLSGRKPENGFHVLAAVLLLSVFAQAGCENWAGADIDADGAENSGKIMAADTVKIGKEIKVRFVVLNGTGSLSGSEGIVSTANDTCLVRNKGSKDDDFYITIPVSTADTYVNIRWQGTDTLSRTVHVKGIMRVKEAVDYAVGFILNKEKGTDGLDVITQNLEEVSKRGRNGQEQDWLSADWEAADSRASDGGRETGKSEYGDDTGTPVTDKSSLTRVITVNFQVLDSAAPLSNLLSSEGIVSWPDDNYLVHGSNTLAEDYSIRIPVRGNHKYLNVRWHCKAFLNERVYIDKYDHFLTARLNLNSSGQDTFTVTLNYAGTEKIVTRNLYAVQGGGYYNYDEISMLSMIFRPNDFPYAVDWNKAKDISDGNEATADIKGIVTVVFNSLNSAGGRQPFSSVEGIVSWPDDKFSVYEKNMLSDTSDSPADKTVLAGVGTDTPILSALPGGSNSITIPVRSGDSYLNIRWRAGIYLDKPLEYSYCYLKARVKTDSLTNNVINITLDYTGEGSLYVGTHKIDTENLDNVEVGWHWDKKLNLSALAADWSAVNTVAFDNRAAE